MRGAAARNCTPPLATRAPRSPSRRKSAQPASTSSTSSSSSASSSSASRASSTSACSRASSATSASPARLPSRAPTEAEQAEFDGLLDDLEEVEASADVMLALGAPALRERLRAVLESDVGPALADAHDAKRPGDCVRARLHRALEKDGLRELLDALEAGRLRRVGGDRRRCNVDRLHEMRRTGALSLTDVRVRHDPTLGNQLELLIDRKAATEGIIPMIAGAKRSIHILMLEYQDGVFGRALTDLLVEKAKEGVKVRMVIAAKNSLQQKGTGSYENVERIVAAGGEVVRQQGYLADYCHDKIVVVDGEEALLGGWTMIDDSYCSKAFRARFDPATAPRDAHGFPIVPDDDEPATHDLLVKVRGPAVGDLQIDFMLTWLYHGMKLDPALSDAAFEAEYRLERSGQRRGNAVDARAASRGSQAQIFKHFSHERNDVYDEMVELMLGAEETIDVEFAYIMSTDIVKLLAAKAKEGVKVRVLVPYDGKMTPRTDALAYRLLLAGYPALLDAGVELWEFKGYNHGKMVVVDDKVAWVGSGNPDPLFSGHPKGGLACDVALVTKDAKLAKQWRRELFEADLQPGRADRITRDFVKRQTWSDWLQAKLFRAGYDAYELLTGARELTFDKNGLVAARHRPALAGPAEALAGQRERAPSGDLRRAG